MSDKPKDPPILSDPLAQAWRRGELTGGEVMTPQPLAALSLNQPDAEERQALIARGVEETFWSLPEHVKAWREAIIIARDHNDDSEEPDSERAFWNQHLEKFDWLFASVLRRIEA